MKAVRDVAGYKVPVYLLNCDYTPEYILETLCRILKNLDIETDFKIDDTPRAFITIGDITVDFPAHYLTNMLDLNFRRKDV